MSLCLVAGDGLLPDLVAQAVAGPLVRASPLGVDGGGAELRFRLETLGGFVETLQARGVDRICFAGGMRRPELDPGAVDAATRPLLPRLSAALGRGDDGALRILLSIFEEAGIAPVGAQDLRPDLLPPAGIMAGPEPAARTLEDAARAFRLLDALSAADLGQACVVARGQTLAVEAAPGTAWMLRSVAAMRRPGDLGLPLPAGGVLAKAPKAGQDLRIDMPAIGPETVAQARAAGLDAVAIAAGGVLVLDRDAVIREAEASGVTLWVREGAA